jgi:hypothetical protein
MDETNILGTIRELVTEEHRLRAEHASSGLQADDVARLRSIENQLDQCWDLMRQRQARAEVGQDPDEAHVRPVAEVESYLQ